MSDQKNSLEKYNEKYEETTIWMERNPPDARIVPFRRRTEITLETSDRTSLRTLKKLNSARRSEKVGVSFMIRKEIFGKFAAF